MSIFANNLLYKDQVQKECPLEIDHCVEKLYQSTLMKGMFCWMWKDRHELLKWTEMMVFFSENNP